MGTPRQSVTLDLDTGSSNMWIATDDCSKCETWKTPDNQKVLL